MNTHIASAMSVIFEYHSNPINPVALRKAKVVYSKHPEMWYFVKGDVIKSLKRSK